MFLLDTDVMVDVLRKHQPALAWLSSVDDEIALPGFVVMELIAGCNTKAELMRLKGELGRYTVLWPSAQSCRNALDIFARCHISHKIGMLDVLIGQMAADSGIPLHTFNLKHYSVIPNLKTIQPYSKKRASP